MVLDYSETSKQIIDAVGGESPMRGVIFGTIAAVLAIGLAFAITFVLFKDEEVA